MAMRDVAARIDPFCTRGGPDAPSAAVDGTDPGTPGAVGI
jgi:hypothetical protein